MSVTVHRRVRGLCKGLHKGLKRIRGIGGGCSKNRGLRFGGG